MKMPLEQHIECLKNMRGTMERQREKAERERSHFLELSERVSRLRDQIDRARNEGRDGFDAERYRP
jgi:hypothetical protein